MRSRCRRRGVTRRARQQPRRTGDGAPDAGRLAAAVHDALAAEGVSEDVAIVWPVAVDLALDTGDVAVAELDAFGARFYAARARLALATALAGSGHEAGALRETAEQTLRELGAAAWAAHGRGPALRRAGAAAQVP